MSGDNILTPVLSETFNGLIWRLKINEKTGFLAVETRNSDLRQVSFSVLNYQTGKVYFKDQTYEETWNLSLEYLAHENLLIKVFENAGSPESKGIISVNLSDGSVIWSKFNIALNEVRNEALQVFDPRIQPHKYFWIDHLTGESAENPAGFNSEFSTLKLPVPDDLFKLPGFIAHKKIAGDFFTLRHRDLNLVSFHEIIDGLVQQRLIVYQENTILLDDILISGIQKLQPEAFFMDQNHLFYIRNKQQIISYLV